MANVKILRPTAAARAVLLAALSLIATAGLSPAGAASWLEKNFYLSGPRYDAVLPPCESESALGRIRSTFATKESRFWNSDLTLREIGSIREVAFRPWAEATIPRRFCNARALTSDGRWRTIHYSIIEDAGIIGAGFGVEWCVVGLDRNWAYNPSCKMARP